MEAKRVLKNPLFLATLAALLLLNAFFFIYQQTDGQGDFREYGNVYHRELNALADLSWEEGLAQCEIAEQEVLENWGSGNNIQRHDVIEQLTAQYEYLLGYEDYLDKIDADAAKLQSVSLFADPDSVAYQNTVKTAEDFHAMDGVSVSMGHDLAVTVVFADKWADYSIVILICVVCGLFVAERKEGLWPMIYAAPGGRWKLVCKRIGILFAASWVGTVLIVGSKVLLCGWVFHGLGEWDRVLQSIPMFQNVPTPLTVAEFWMLYITVKAMETKGHTDCSMSYAFEPVKLLFASESTGIIEGKNFVHTPFLKDCNDAISSREKCKTYDPEYISLPHFGMIPKDYIETYWKRLEEETDIKIDFIRKMKGKFTNFCRIQD